MLQVLSPYDQGLIKEIPLQGKEKVEEALSTAYCLFSHQSNWIPAYYKIAKLERTVQ